MELKLAETIVENYNHYHKAEGSITLYKEYHGRGSFGTTTNGIVVKDIGRLISFLIENADLFVINEEGDVFPSFELATSLKIDSLGKDFIIY